MDCCDSFIVSHGFCNYSKKKKKFKANTQIIIKIFKCRLCNS